MANSPDAVTITEEKDHDGLASIMSCKFNGCGQQITFSTSTKTTGLTGRAHWTNNLAAVWGQIVIGGGFNSLEESMSVLDVPVMTKSFIHTMGVDNFGGVYDSCRKRRKANCNAKKTLLSWRILSYNNHR